MDQDGFKLNGAHQLLVYADDVNILGGRVPNIEENTEALVVAMVKGKAIPLQAWTGPEDSRSLRLPDFKTIGT